MKNYLFAIETSCDETAVALFDINTNSLIDEITNSQITLHAPFGGVVPELASRAHIQKLPILVDTLFSRNSIKYSQLAAIAVTNEPGLKGCLLVGTSYAQSLAYSLNIPCIPIHHLEGHMYAWELNKDAQYNDDSFMALIVSGGHTELVIADSFRKYKTIAKTKDDAAGEAFDKIASLLKLPYPGGPALSKLAEHGNHNRFPIPVGMKDDPTSFSFSGLKTAALKLIAEYSEQIRSDEQLKADIAASIELGICNSLIIKTMQACKEYGVKHLIITGGVAANKRLRYLLISEAKNSGIKCSIPEFKWCTDNAAMIGNVGLKLFKQKSIFNTMTIQTRSALETLK